MKDNMVKFKNKNKISESEITSLFLGLVKLVKKLALEEASAQIPKNIRMLKEEIDELNLELSRKESEIDKLKEENSMLKSKIKVKNMKILQISCMSAKKLNEYKI
jgi:chromosome segregation ATPase